MALSLNTQPFDEFGQIPLAAILQDVNMQCSKMSKDSLPINSKQSSDAPSLDTSLQFSRHM